jgi:hypothetical protein
MSSCSDTHCPTGTTGHERGLHATAAGGGRIAAISAHIRQHLARDYQIPPGALIDLAVSGQNKNPYTFTISRLPGTGASCQK